MCVAYNISLRILLSVFRIPTVSIKRDTMGVKNTTDLPSLASIFLDILSHIMKVGDGIVCTVSPMLYQSTFAL